MKIVFEEESLKELYEKGTTCDKKYKFLQQDIVKRFVKTVNTLKSADKIETLFLINSLNYEKLVGDKKGIESVRVNSKYRLEFRTQTEGEIPNSIVICNIIELSNHYS